MASAAIVPECVPLSNPEGHACSRPSRAAAQPPNRFEPRQRNGPRPTIVAHTAPTSARVEPGATNVTRAPSITRPHLPARSKLSDALTFGTSAMETPASAPTHSPLFGVGGGGSTITIGGGAGCGTGGGEGSLSSDGGGGGGGG